MSNITEHDIERIAKLARIGVTPEETKSLAIELDGIVGYVEQLKSAKLTDYDPTDQVTGLRNVTREDKVIKSELSRSELLANAPMVKDGYVLVKRVLNG